jgi:hypothetical protein
MRNALAMLLALSALAASSASAQDGWLNLFNGKDLSGWTQKTGDAKYLVEDGCLVGQAVAGSKTNSFLCTEKDYDNFFLELDFKCDSVLNSGVQIRSEWFAHPTQVEWKGKTIKIPAGYVHGYQVEIDADAAKKRWWTAGIYDERRRLWLYPGQLGGSAEEFTQQGGRIFKTNDWNHLRIEAVGPSIKTFLNGVPCADITDSMTSKGFIGLQVHQIGNNESHAGAQVRFKNIRLKPVAAALPPPAGAK